MIFARSTLASIAVALLSVSTLNAAPSPHDVKRAASSKGLAINAANTAACAAASVVTVHDVQTVFVTVGAQAVATAGANSKKTTTARTTTSVRSTTTARTTTSLRTTTSARATTSVRTTTSVRPTTSARTTTSARPTITAKPQTNNQGGKNNNKGGKNNNKGKPKIVTVTQTIKHVKPIFKVITKTKNNKVIVTSTAVSTVISTEIKTVTAEPTPTTVISTATLDRPITITATVTEQGQEVIKTTEVLTQIVTVTSDVVKETLATTVTENVATTASAATTTAVITDSVATTDIVTTDSAASTEVATTDAVATTETATTDSVATTQAATTTTDSVITTDSAVATATATTSDAGIQSASRTAGVASASETASATASAAGPDATEDPQTSLTLDPRSVMSSQASDGNPSDGQVPSLTSTNNFMNFCLTQNVPITNGQQVKTGSCNPVPMGRIISTDRMPSAVFLFPANFGTIPAEKGFTIQLKIKNLVTGNFVNAANNYYSAPAQVNPNGILIGHSHCVIEPLDSFDQTKPTDPTTFSFFKGLNGVAQEGVLTADVTGGLPAGKYRIGTINAASNHQPGLMSVAQHGTIDAWAYFTVE